VRRFLFTMANDNPQTPNAMAAALGAVAVSVTTLEGVVIAAQVRLLRVSEFPRFFELIDKEEELVVFATNLAADAVACLSPNAILDIVDKIFELNFPTAQRWAERRARLGGAAKSFEERVTKTSPS